MMAIPLDFDPGSKYQYSNVGYMLLEGVIEKIAGEPYERFVRRNVLVPAGMERTFLGAAKDGIREDRAKCYLAGSDVEVPPMNLPMAMSAAGWNASAVDLARLLTALDGSRGKRLLDEKTFAAMVAPPPAPIAKRPNGSYPGLGWPVVNPSGKQFGYLHDGKWTGMRTFMKCNPAKRMNWALLFNVAMQPDPDDRSVTADAARECEAVIERALDFPDLDLFATYK
jgi:CubicO group peptidase (beta-lactamase class C family)